MSKEAGHTFLAKLENSSTPRGKEATDWLIQQGHFHKINKC